MGLSCATELPSKVDPLMVDIEPVCLGVNLEQLGFHLIRGVVVSGGKAQPMGDTEHMGVNGNTLRVPKRLAHDHIGGFPAYAG